MAAGAEPGAGERIRARIGSVMSQISSNVYNENPHWSRHLKCQVCFGYLRQPHTLNCGHTFCKVCLVQLARTIKAANSQISLRHLTLPCPTCRALFPAPRVMRGNASTSFLVQNLVCDWKKERKRLQSSSTVTLRSICTQTTNRRAHRLRRRKSPSAAQLDLHEEFHRRLKLDDFYFKSMTAINSESSEEIDLKPQQPTNSRPLLNTSETSTTSSTSSGSGYAFGRRFSDLSQHLAARQRIDWSPGRVLLMSVWCMYSMVVVGIAQPMLPYMVIITLFFLLVILK